ncbi:MAG: VWA domain-containing protein [Candidatus Saccharimonadales bacterium]
MIFQPIIKWWILLPIAILMIGFASWQTFKTRSSPKRIMHANIRRLIMVLLIVAIGFRPSLPGGNTKTGSSSLDVFLAVDTTTSMVAEDYNGKQPRLDGVKHDLTAIMTQLAGARFTLVTFNSKALDNLPLTTDASALQALIDTMQTETTYYSDGSDIGSAADLLKQKMSTARQERPERKRILFYLGDGEQTAKSKPSSFANLKPYVNGGAVLGYGTAAGGTMMEQGGYVSKDYPATRIVDRTTDAWPQKDAVSKIDESNLRNIASQIGVSYVHRLDQSDIKTMLRQTKVDKVRASSKEIDTYRDVYWVFAIPLAALLLIDVTKLLDELAMLRSTKPRRKD